MTVLMNMYILQMKGYIDLNEDWPTNIPMT